MQHSFLHMKSPRILRLLASSCALALSLKAQTTPAAPVYRWTTLAGRASFGAEDGALAQARFNNPHGLAMNAAGDVYVADTGNHTVRKISRGGVVTTFAGTAGRSGYVDGAGEVARFTSPTGIAIDSAGNVYVTDAGNYLVRKITPTGIVSTLAGQAGKPGHTDGPAAAALFTHLAQISVDPTGNVYVMDDGLRRIANGTVETLRPLAADPFNNPHGSVAAAASGDVYFAEPGGQGVFKRTPGGAISTVVGTGPQGPSPQLFPNNQGWVGPMTTDASGNLHFAAHYFSTYHDYYWAQLNPAGELSLRGTHFKASSGRPELPRGMALNADGYLLFTRPSDDAIGWRGPNNEQLFAGTPWSPEAVPGIGAAARFSGLNGLAVDRNGQVLVANGNITFLLNGRDLGGTDLCRITQAGEMTVSFSTPRMEGLEITPLGVAVDPANNAMVAAFDYIARFYQVSAAGGATVVSSGEVSRPQGLAYDAAGNLFVIDSDRRVHRRDPAGAWTVLAGTNAAPEIKDGRGTDARFADLSAVTVGGSDAYVLDAIEENGRVARSYIRRVQPDGTVTTVSTNLVKSTGEYPRGLAISAQGAFVLVYPLSHTVTQISGNAQEVVIGGTAFEAGNRDGTGADARFSMPWNVATDAQNNIFITDAAGTTVRKGEFLGLGTTISSHPQSLTVAAGGAAQFSVTAAGTPAPTYQWQFNGAAINGATSSTLTLASVSTASAGNYTVAVTNTLGTVTSNPATLTVTTPAPPPTPPPSGGTGGGSGGGGGAPSLWFLLALAAASAARFVRRNTLVR
jgi:hypothetical protein